MAVWVDLEVPVTDANFDEDGYLAANPDVVVGDWQSGRQHYEAYGRSEGRKVRLLSASTPLRAEKLRRLEGRLRDDMPFERRGLTLDFLTPELRRESAIVATQNVGSNRYDGYVEALIEELSDGLILDCGAGRRDRYYANVVNLEIVAYDSTDVLGVGEKLPFKDATFDGVVSIAVLEHVRDPFQCAAEIARVLKPGGRLICCVPFLQPVHGYPRHYYNMTREGLRALFERWLKIDDHRVIASMLPIWSLHWVVDLWAAGLSAETRERFLDMPVRELLRPPDSTLGEPWVRELSEEKNFELASATLLFARKPE